MITREADVTTTALNRRQELFCHEYVVDANGAQAAIRAGYAEVSARVTACRLLGKPAVQDRVAELMSERMERVGVDADVVLYGLRTVVDRSLQARQVLDREGEPTGEWEFNAAGANRALELLGRHLGLFNDRLQLGLAEGRVRELIDQVVQVIVRHVEDPAVLAAIRADVAEVMGTNPSEGSSR